MTIHTTVADLECCKGDKLSPTHVHQSWETKRSYEIVQRCLHIYLANILLHHEIRDGYDQ